MLRRVVATAAVLHLLTAVCLAQSNKPQSSEITSHGEAVPKSIVIDSDGKAREMVAKILLQYGLLLHDDSWQIWITNDVDETPYASSNFTEKRQIYFNRAFMSRMAKDGGTVWPLFAIAAHEVGHHLSNHVLRPRLHRQRAEREADYHMGFVLGRMGARYDQTVSVIRYLPGSNSVKYPPREQRICEIGRGWRDANNLEAIPGEDRDTNGTQQVCVGENVDANKFQLRFNRDIYGHDISIGGLPYLQGIDMAACSKKCSSMKECKAFSFDRWGGVCYLKDTLSGLLIDPPSVVGVKSTIAVPAERKDVPVHVEIVRQRMFHDQSQQAAVTTQSTEDCARKCESTPRCVAFTFQKAKKKCQMIEKTIGHFIDERGDVGYKQQSVNR